MKRHAGGLLLAGVALAALAAGALRAADDLVLGDFEGDTYGAWQAVGEAFGPGPARGTLPNQMPVDGFKGRGLVNSYRNGDGATGTLTSPEFRISRRYLTFLVGGGGYPGKTCVDLLVDGQVVRTATGPNTEPGGSEKLEPHFWDLADLAGKSARIRIVDAATGGWGHINADEFVLTDRRPPMVRQDVRREITVTHRYLHLPVKTGAPKRRMSVRLDGRAAREFEIELADGPPDFHAFLDLEPFRGKPLTLQVDRLPEDSRALEQVTQSDSVPDEAGLYREPLRPQFHFSSRRGWNNDPNGLVYHAGEWHLFYQHNPYGWAWGNMHWGHAVSRDLVHWRELPIALYPREFGDWAFSGSAVTDRGNTAGFKTGREDVLVAAYTSTGRGECLVYSSDRGRTWTEYAGNPVVKHHGRDPRLLWHAPTRRWVMAVYDENAPGEPKRQSIAFYTSPDLKQWEYASRIDGYYECPDLFELPVEGAPGQRRWVLLGADGGYAVGRFDGRVFTPEGEKRRGHWGNAFYASQTWSDAPDGRRVQIAWGTVNLPGMPFNQMMTFPCDLSLRSTPEGPRMAYRPVPEIEKLARGRERLRVRDLPPGEHEIPGADAELLDLRLEIEPRDAAEIGIHVRGVPLTWNRDRGELACLDRAAPVRLSDGKLRLRVLVDRASLEIFAEDGLVYMPMGVVLKPEARGVRLSVRGGSARLAGGEAAALRSAWERRP